MSMKAFSSKLSGKGYSSKITAVQCIQALYIMYKVKKMRLASCNFKLKKEANKCEQKKLFQIKRDIGMVLSHEL